MATVCGPSAAASSRCSQREATAGASPERADRVRTSCGVPIAIWKSCAACPMRPLGRFEVKPRLHQPRHEAVRFGAARPAAFVEPTQHQRVDRLQAGFPITPQMKTLPSPPTAGFTDPPAMMADRGSAAIRRGGKARPRRGGQQFSQQPGKLRPGLAIVEIGDRAPFVTGEPLRGASTVARVASTTLVVSASCRNATSGAMACSSGGEHLAALPPGAGHRAARTRRACASP